MSQYVNGAIPSLVLIYNIDPLTLNHVEVVVQFMICIASCLLDFFTSLKHFVAKVLPLGCFFHFDASFGMLFCSMLNPWGYFWSNFDPLGSFLKHFVHTFWC